MEEKAKSYPNLYLGRCIGLEPVNERHFEFLYQVRLQVELAPLWQSRRRFPTQAEYLRELVDHLAFNLFVIIRLTDKPYPIGFVYDYDHNQEDGYTYIASAMLESHMRQGLGAEASFVFLDWLFNTYPLRKVYSDVYGYNRLSLSTTRSGGFKEEGCLLQHRYWQGRFWDLHRFGMFREDWIQVKRRLGNNFGRPLSENDLAAEKILIDNRQSEVEMSLP